MRKLCEAAISLDDAEYADLARLAKVEFRIFCQNHDLPFHFPDVEKLDVKKATEQFPLFDKALNIFNRANANRIFVVDGIPVTFSYSFGGLDLEYQAYNPKMLLRAYLDLEAEQAPLKKRGAFWIATSLLVLFICVRHVYGGWAWVAFALIAAAIYLIWSFKQLQARNNSMKMKTELQKEIDLLRNELNQR